MRTLLLCLLMFPVCVFAYASVISSPLKASEVLVINNAEKPQEFFGRLDGFPHTYEFAVQSPFHFKAEVFVPDLEAQANDASLIVIKEEKRGVSEVGRTKGKQEAWGEQKDAMLVETFRAGGVIDSELQPGVYRLEASSPNNDAVYRLVLGSEKVSRGYLDNIRALFEIKSLLGTSKFTMLKSPLIYWPVGLIVGGIAVWYLYLYRYRYKRS